MFRNPSMGDAHGPFGVPGGFEPQAVVTDCAGGALNPQYVVKVDQHSVLGSPLTAAIIGPYHADAGLMIVGQSDSAGQNLPRFVTEAHTFALGIDRTGQREALVADMPAVAIPLASQRKRPAFVFGIALAERLGVAGRRVQQLHIV